MSPLTFPQPWQSYNWTHFGFLDNDPLHVDVITHLLVIGQDLPGELDLTAAQCATAPWITPPTEEKAYELPHGVQAQTAGHHRVTGEVTGEKPQVRVDIELCDQLSLAGCASLRADVADTVHHQHIFDRQLRVAGAEQLAHAAGDQFGLVVMRLRSKRGRVGHSVGVPVRAEAAMGARVADRRAKM